MQRGVEELGEFWIDEDAVILSYHMSYTPKDPVWYIELRVRQLHERLALQAKGKGSTTLTLVLPQLTGTTNGAYTSSKASLSSSTAFITKRDIIKTGDWRRRPRETLFPDKKRMVIEDEGWGYFVDAKPPTTRKDATYRRLFAR